MRRPVLVVAVAIGGQLMAGCVGPVPDGVDHAVRLDARRTAGGIH
jgi:hypothetical protein